LGFLENYCSAFVLSQEEELRKKKDEIIKEQQRELL